MSSQPAIPPMRIVVMNDFHQASPAPSANEVWVWAISLAAPPTEAAELFGDLTPEEQTRADRYKVVAARLQFVIGRGLLRRLLSRHMGVVPRDVLIRYTGSGKPFLADSRVSLHFNVTHTDNFALIAMARQTVGIDIERLRPVSEPEGLVRRFFSSAERETFLALPDSLRSAGFFRGWTCKEAVIKAAGLSVASLDEFDVELHPARPPALLAARHPALMTASWQLSAWEPIPGYCAAVAISESIDLVTRTLT
jgi:4'-phosphopantetheinyl transferase